MAGDVDKMHGEEAGEKPDEVVPFREPEPPVPHNLRVYEEIQRGWQDTLRELATKAIEAIEKGAASAREASKRISYAILIVVTLLFLVIAALTWQGIVPGEALTFLLGIVVGYLLSVMPFRPTR